MKGVLLLAGAAAAVALSSCQPAYYAQLIRGHYDLLARREPIEWMLERPGLDAGLRARLERAVDARRFASRTLALPENRSYTLYADLHRPAALWNVFATAEFSLQPYEWCYWLTGCLAYRGYYELPEAEAEAGVLRGEGYDVHVGPVPAYSTLGWFDDPVLSTVLTSDDRIAGTIFHELAHQQRFVRGDTAFNESFATFVEQEGLREYLRGEPALGEIARRRQGRHEQFVGLMLGARQRLEALYASGLPPPELRARKAAEFEQLRRDYAVLKATWGGDGGYDGWMEGGLNNARLLPFGLYHQWIPAFDALFARSGRNWQAFYAQVGELGGLDPVERRRRLETLSPAKG